MGLRQERLADEIRDILATCFMGGQMEDPRLKGVTITAVKLTADLQLATVYFRVIQEDETETVKRGLDRASGFLKKRLAEVLKIRRVPDLRFMYDESIERGSRMEDLLRNLN